MKIMDHLDVHMLSTTTKQEIFNWDDIDVGNNQLNHSQHFFAKKHIKHEKNNRAVGIDVLNEKMALTGLEEPTNKPALKSGDIKEPITAQAIPTIVDSTAEQIDPENNCNLANGPAAETSQNGKKCTPSTKPPVPNIACKWTCERPIGKLALTSAAPSAPKAYKYSYLYQRNKEEAIRKRTEEERKMREFHSRPVPNFGLHREQLERRKVAHAVTVAVTPQVLKKSRETEEKRRQKLEEWQRKHQPPKFEPRTANVLKEKPFVPQKSGIQIQQRPFKLHSEQRLQERKLYDAAIQHALEEKSKQEEEERKKRDENKVKELRKMATFKARPNPFSKQQKQQ